MNLFKLPSQLISRIALVLLALLAILGIGGASFWAARYQTLQAELDQAYLQLRYANPLRSSSSIAKTECEPEPLADQTLKQICSAYHDYAETEQISNLVDNLVAERIARDIEHKYSYLFQVMTLGKQDSAQLTQLMADREAVLNAPVQGYFADPDELQAIIDEQRTLLETIDGQVRALLNDNLYNKYDLLKNSDLEQFQIEQFSQGLEADQQISLEQKSQLLIAKLQYKKQFEQQLISIEEHFSGSSQFSSENAVGDFDFERIAEAFEAFKAAYYSDSAAVLNQTQLTRLKAFEDAQFDALFQSLQRQLDR
jgi:hypothetical protein